MQWNLYGKGQKQKKTAQSLAEIPDKEVCVTSELTLKAVYLFLFTVSSGDSQVMLGVSDIIFCNY